MRNAELTPEACFVKALDIAHHQEAKSCELRAATSPELPQAGQDKRQEAYDLLAPVYGWFTDDNGSWTGRDRSPGPGP